jgi:1-acyl-sn-glycerol-3-phosphate acyltransferase
MVFVPTKMTRRKSSSSSSSPLLRALFLVLLLVVVVIMSNNNNNNNNKSTTLLRVNAFFFLAAPSRLSTGLQRLQDSSTPEARTVSTLSKTRRPTLFVLHQSSSTASVASSSSSTSMQQREEDSAPVTATSLLFNDSKQKQQLSKSQSALVRLGMISFIVSMCLALPVTLLPQKLLYKLGMINRTCKERWALSTAQWCARTLMRIFPFCQITAYPYHNPDPPPSIWCANHASMLDVFVMLAADKKLRGPKRRPIKIIYWKQLEDNPISKLLFQQAGFIPVQMAANKPGEANEYDKSSFKQLVRSARQCFQDGFDLGILPEGQLNPTPELGLQHVFPGAFTLAKMGGQRPIQMMALHGIHQLWHPSDDKGMQCTNRNVAIKVYPSAIQFDSAPDFVACFNAVVGHFATYGYDLPEPELQFWLSGKSQHTKTKNINNEVESSLDVQAESDKKATTVSPVDVQQQSEAAEL